MNPARRRFLHLAASGAALPILARIAWALDYPTRPVRFVVGFPAGEAPDIVARLITQKLSKQLGQQFVVENQPGAGSNIATEAVVSAVPNGYTLLQVSLTNAVNDSLYKNLSFNFARDIAPIASICGVPFVMTVNPSVPAKTVPEFITYAKANPGKVNMASAGNGTAPHVFGELFMMMTGVDLIHVPYRGNFIPDVLAGQVQVAFMTVLSAIPYVRDGKLRALAVTTATRSNRLPETPVMAQFVPDYQAIAWLGVGAPKKTSVEIISKLNNEINACLADPDMKGRLVALGVKPMSMTPNEFAKFIASESEKWSKVIKFANIKVE
jgi:tripartite-type tricarboxylate transporter receptor subunit TctC